MALLDILHYPDPRLRMKASVVNDFGDEIQSLIDNLLETMYASRGIGLAATQVNVHQRVLVADISEDATSPVSLINPRLIHHEGFIQKDEGCLSLPGITEMVKRYDEIVVEANSVDGNTVTLEAAGLLSVCLQHEMDHLDGRLFIDHLSYLKRTRLTKKFEKKLEKA